MLEDRPPLPPPFTTAVAMVGDDDVTAGETPIAGDTLIAGDTPAMAGEFTREPSAALETRAAAAEGSAAVDSASTALTSM